MKTPVLGLILLLAPTISGCHISSGDPPALSSARPTGGTSLTGVEPKYHPRFAPRTRGSGPVTVYELFDFQCPFCRDFALHTFPAVDSAYLQSGRIRWVVINNPLARHANAARVAEVLICAGRAGKFWELSDRVLERQDDWAGQERPDSVLYLLAHPIGLDSGAVAQCLNSGAGKAELKADVAFLATMGFSHEGVPTFVVGGRKVAQGAVPFATFRRVLDSLLATHSRGT